MQKFSFNHNDYVIVTLTKEGAEHITAKHKAFYDQHPRLKRCTKEYVEGETLKTQFWCLVGDFHEMLTMGSKSPFKDGTLVVESSIIL